MLINKIKLFFFIYFCHILIIPTDAQIQHIEPLNWWVGMKNQNLQLLVQGKNVGELTPKINYKGVSIKKVNKADSKNYLFIDLNIAKNTKAGSFFIHFQKSEKDIYTYEYTLLERQEKPEKHLGFSAADVIYLITPDRFANGDYSNDVVDELKENKINRNFEGGRHGGDLQGIEKHLDYIADMGFTALWLNPILENDMTAYSYHGYAITNHYKVDPRYGTLDDYKNFAYKARQKGIKLVFDGVINHIGINHWWMKDLPFKDWINFPDRYQPTNHRRTTNEDPYTSQYDKNLMTKGWFDTTMPDLNGLNPFMATYLIQNSIWWIETLQLGSIRQDTYGYSDKSFLTKWSCGVMEEYPNFSIVGEEWSYNPLITSYWQREKAQQYGYQSCLKNTMDFPLQRSLIQALIEKDEPNFSKGLFKLYDALSNDFVYADPNNLMVFGDNHDMDRLYTQLNKDAKLTQIALTYLLTIRGIPQIYYGTEILMDNSEHLDNHGFIRADFPGGWNDDATNGFTGVGLNKEQIETQSYLKKLLAWRKNETLIHNGKTLHFAPFGGVYAYFRYNEDKMIMVVLNKNEENTNIDTQRFNEILKNKKNATNVISGEIIDLNKPVQINGKSAIILEIIN